MGRIRELRRRVDERAAAEALAGATLCQHLEDRIDPLHRRPSAARQFLLDVLTPLVTAALQVAGDQVVLRGEVGVERGLGRPGAGDDLVDADGVDARASRRARRRRRGCARGVSSSGSSRPPFASEVQHTVRSDPSFLPGPLAIIQTVLYGVEATETDRSVLFVMSNGGSEDRLTEASRTKSG